MAKLVVYMKFRKKSACTYLQNYSRSSEKRPETWEDHLCKSFFFFLSCENQALVCSLFAPAFHHWFNSVIGALSDQ